MGVEFIRKQDVKEGLNTNIFMTNVLMKLLGLSKFNKLYKDFYPLRGVELVDKAIDFLNINIEFDERDLRKIPKKGSFITVSNHPFGLLDGVILVCMIRKVRPDFKVTANFLLQLIEPMEGFFIPVDPFGTKKSRGGSTAVLKELEEGHGVGFFPAGEVSTYYKGTKGVVDKEWSKSAINLIHEAKVPVVPFYFDGKNSNLFHIIGQLHPLLRTAQIPSEFLKKKNKSIGVRIGSQISVSEIEKFENSDDFGRYLRARVYMLGAALEKKKKIKLKMPQLNQKAKSIESAKPLVLIETELKKIKDKSLVFDQGGFELYIVSSNEIPNLLHEIGRLRELTFREVGEGTNKELDIDEYDKYYQQLFLWDKENKKLVGGYRLGNGCEIYRFLGKKGFYLNSLFHFKGEMEKILGKSLELGRSFIVKEYQQKTFPLLLLWKGIAAFLLKNPACEYMIGPVSISNDYSFVSKSCMISFLKEHFFDNNLVQYVKPRKEFKPVFKKLDKEVLLGDEGCNLSKLDRVIKEIEPAHYRVPVLIKQYIKLNAKLIGFNLDPSFNNSLDGLIIAKVSELPDEIFEVMNR